MKTCPKCGGFGVKNQSISKGVMNNICSVCNGSGQVPDYSSGVGKDGRGSCFPAGTNICTPSGNLPIEKINCGDFVIAVDQFGQKLIRRVTKHISFGNRSVSKITFDDATYFSVTDHHTIKTLRGWVRVRDLQIGDELIETWDRKTLISRKIDLIERNVSNETVYNIVVEGECTFIADGVIAHSFTNLRVLRSAFHKICYILKPSNSKHECTAA